MNAKPEALFHFNRGHLKVQNISIYVELKVQLL